MFQIRSMIAIAFFLFPLIASSDDFRRENEKKILRVYDQILKNVEVLNNSNAKLTEDEKANRVFSFLVNKKGDGFWFASACRVSYDNQLIINKYARGKKDLFWDDDDFLKRKRLFYKAILEHNIHLLGESQFETSHQLAQKEAKIYFFDLEKQELLSEENLRSEKLNQYLYQCNRMSSVFDKRQLPPLPDEEKSSNKTPVTDNNSSKQSPNSSVAKSVNSENTKNDLEISKCFGILSIAVELDGTIHSLNKIYFSRYINNHKISSIISAFSSCVDSQDSRLKLCEQKISSRDLPLFKSFEEGASEYRKYFHEGRKDMTGSLKLMCTSE